jgi:predicted hydrolase (HD superfamily)
MKGIYNNTTAEVVVTHKHNTQEKNMFTFESIIDTVKGAQTKFVETYVTDKKVQAEIVKAIDAQATFTKTTYNNSLEIAQTAMKNLNDIVYKKA